MTPLALVVVVAVCGDEGVVAAVRWWRLCRRRPLVPIEVDADDDDDDDDNNTAPADELELAVALAALACDNVAYDTERRFIRLSPVVSDECCAALETIVFSVAVGRLRNTHIKPITKQQQQNDNNQNVYMNCNAANETHDALTVWQQL